LRVADVVFLEGIWSIRIVPEAGPLKPRRSERAIPLHNAILSTGFLDFVRRLLRPE
jgi:hypothetical protein